MNEERRPPRGESGDHSGWRAESSLAHECPGACPSCGRVAADLAHLVDDHRALVREVVREVDALRAEVVREVDALRAEVVRVRTEAEEAAEDVAGLRSGLDETGVYP